MGEADTVSAMDRSVELADRSSRERDALDAAVQSIAGVLDLDRVLQLIVDRVRELANGEYAAIGIIGPDATLERFVTSGVSNARRRRIGALPEGRGLLGVIIRESESLRIADITTDDRRSGFPAHHPPMHSFLGVPVRLRDHAIGNFYLTNKRGRPSSASTISAWSSASRCTLPSPSTTRVCTSKSDDWRSSKSETGSVGTCTTA